MFKRSKEKSSIEILFPIALFLVFTLGALFIILYSARTYQHIVEGSEASYNSSTHSSYISQKVHSYDREKSVYVSNIAQTPILVLEEQIDNTDYVTLIYHYDGKIRELFTAKNMTSFQPSAGMPLFDAEGFNAQQISDRLFLITIDTAEGTYNEYISTMSGEKML